MSAKSDLRQIFLVHLDGKLLAYSAYDQEKIELLPKGKPLKAQFTQSRSIPENNLYWAMLRVTIDNHEYFTQPEPLHRMLLAALGLVEPFIDIDGNMQMIPSSTAFDKMETDAFQRYFSDAANLICQKILPGTNPDDLIHEAKTRCGYKKAA